MKLQIGIQINLVNFNSVKVGITFSAFDLFHAGHVKMLEEAKTKCDYLIVGIQLDPDTGVDLSNKDKKQINRSLLGCKTK